MDAIIYTKSAQEYEMLSGILADELPGTAALQGVMDGHYHLEERYDIAVISVDGAQGMELVCAYRERFGDTLVVWITDDPYFARVAIRTHIFDFIVRPLTEQGFRETVRKLKSGEIDALQKMPAGRTIYQGGGYGCRENIPGNRNGTVWERIKRKFSTGIFPDKKEKRGL